MPQWIYDLDDRFPWLVFVVAPFLGAGGAVLIGCLAWLASWPF